MKSLASHILSFICFLLILLQFSTCKKDTESPIPNGWQESMQGKLLYTRHYITGDYTSDRLFCIDKEGKKSITPSGQYYDIEGVKWSADGSRIVFGTNTTGLWIVNADGSDAKSIHENKYGTRTPDWLAGDSSLIYGNHMGMHIINQDGELIRDLPEAGGNIDCSPDGSIVVYDQSLAVQYNIKILNLETNSSQRLFEDINGTTFPAWSSDGSQLAFRYRDSVYTQIFICDWNGSNIQQVTHFIKGAWADNFAIYQPAWSPDDQMIAFGTSEGTYVYRINGELVTLIPKEYGDAHKFVDWK